jgi:hypothetical protein
MPELEIGKGTLKVGSEDGCTTLPHGAEDAVEQSLNIQMNRVARRLGLAVHEIRREGRVVRLGFGADVEGHVDCRGAARIIDTARVFPPEDPKGAPHLPRNPRDLSIFWRLLRPELVAMVGLKKEGLLLPNDGHAEPGLSADGFTAFTNGAKDAWVHMRRLKAATQFMMDVQVPKVAEALAEQLNQWWDGAGLAVIFHKLGVNMRHLGAVWMHLGERCEELRQGCSDLGKGAEGKGKEGKGESKGRGKGGGKGEGGDGGGGSDQIGDDENLLSILTCVSLQQDPDLQQHLLGRADAQHNEALGQATKDLKAFLGARQAVVQELFVRSAKNLLRDNLRRAMKLEAGAYEIEEIASETFTCLASGGPGAEAHLGHVWQGVEKRFGVKVDEAQRGGISAIRAIRRVAKAVGVRLTQSCLGDLEKEVANVGGTNARHPFAFTVADVEKMQPRVKILDILNKAEGMALADQLREPAFGGGSGGRVGDSYEGKGGKGSGGGGSQQDFATNVATRLRLLNQAAAKLRIAARGVFPDQYVALKLAEIRCEQVQLELNGAALRVTAGRAFEELRSFPRDGKIGTTTASSVAVGGRGGSSESSETIDAMLVRLAVELAGALLGNSNLGAEDGVNVLRDGLVRTRGVGSSVRPPVQLMEPGVRESLGDRIVRWGIDQWGDEGEREKHVVAFEAFVNGPLALLVGCGTEEEGGGGEAGEEKKGNIDENSVESIACGDKGVNCLEEAREWIKEMMVVETLKDFAKCVGVLDGAGGNSREGVTFDGERQVMKIEWKEKNLNGNLDRLGDLGDLLAEKMPRLQVLDLSDNSSLTGDIAQLNLPVGMQTVEFEGCAGLTGAVDKLVLPVGMQTVNFAYTEVTGDIAQLNLPVGMQTVDFMCCKRLTGAVDKLVLPEGMQAVNFYECTGLAGDIAQMNLPVGMQSVNFSLCYDLTGAVDKLVLPEGMQIVNFSKCTGLTGSVDKLVLPEGMQSVNFYECTGLAGDIAQMNLPVGMQSVNFRQCRGLTGAVDKLALPEGMQIVDFSWCSGLTGKLPATERAKVKDYHGP